MNYADFEEKKVPYGESTRACEICGQHYGLHNFDIHDKQCKDSWISEVRMKEKCDKKPVPNDPTDGMALHDINLPYCKSTGELTEIDETYNAVSLSVCLYCGRSFLCEKLIIHNKSCTAENPGRPVKTPLEPRFAEECVIPIQRANKPRWGSSQIPIHKISRTESEGSMAKKKIPTVGRNSTRYKDNFSSRSRSASPQPSSGSISERSNHDYSTDMRECSTTEQSDSESGPQLNNQIAFNGYDEAKEVAESSRTRKDSCCTDSSMSKNSAPINLPDRVDEMEFTVALMADTITEMELIVADLQANIKAKKKEKQKEKEKNCIIC